MESLKVLSFFFIVPISYLLVQEVQFFCMLESGILHPFDMF
jgi:hypothetical protein